LEKSANDMMKRYIFWSLLSTMLVIALIGSVSASNDEWAYTSKTLKTDIKISSELELKPLGVAAESRYVKADLTFVPLNTWRQRVSNMDTTPNANLVGDTLSFKWSEPDIGSKLIYQVRATVETDYGLKRVSQKIDFPLTKKDTSGVEDYLKFTENIDINSDISKLANDLAQGEDDLYRLVFKISEWVKNNIEYNLSFSETLEKPSDTFKVRQGVCDEITALFVSILRDIGIPTKYVSGYAYTNLKTPPGFGPHAWAEVYFPSVGWVPFDITYNEFGFIDAAHIKLKESFDSGGYSSKYEWRGRDITLQTKALEFNAEVKEIGEKIDHRVTLKAQFLKSQVGFGSYNILEVEVQNLNNHYTGLTVYATLSNEMTFLDGNTRDLLLVPYETKKLHWTTKLSDDLDSKYSYLVPVRVYFLNEISATANFTASSKNIMYSLDNLELLSNISREQETKHYSKNLQLSCSASPSLIYVGKEFTITCDLSNTGNTVLSDLDVCYQDDCKTVTINIASTKIVTFSYVENTSGQHEVIVTASNEDVSKVSQVEFMAHNPPKVEISNINHADMVEFQDTFKIDFLIKKKTTAPIGNVSVFLDHGSQNKRWDLDEMTIDRRFLIDLKGNDLKPGNNTFTISVVHTDMDGNLINISKDFDIKLVNTSFTQNLWLGAEDVLRTKSKFGLFAFAIFAFSIGGLLGFILHSISKVHHKSKKLSISKEAEELKTLAEEDGDDIPKEELEEAVYEVIEENEKLIKEKAHLEAEKRRLEKEKKRLQHIEKSHHHRHLEPPKKKSLFGKLFSSVNKKKAKLVSENPNIDPTKMIKELEHKIEKDIEEEFEKLEDESEKLKRKRGFV